MAILPFHYQLVFLIIPITKLVLLVVCVFEPEKTLDVRFEKVKRDQIWIFDTPGIKMHSCKVINLFTVM